MPNKQEEFITGTIDDYLLALADGIVKAQDELNKIAVQSAPDQPAMHYHLPKLDFELKMSFNLETEKTSEATSKKPRLSHPGLLHNKGIGSKRLRAMPINPENTSENFSSEAVSTISGSFVALPVNGGKPPNILSLAVLKTDKTAIEVLVSVRNAIGEAIVDQAVELSIDREFSESLNAERKLPAAQRTLKAETDFKESVVMTKEDGEARATLAISPREHLKSSIVIEAFAGNLTETLIIQVAS